MGPVDDKKKTTTGTIAPVGLRDNRQQQTPGEQARSSHFAGPVEMGGTSALPAAPGYTKTPATPQISYFPKETAPAPTATAAKPTAGTGLDYTGTGFTGPEDPAYKAMMTNAPGIPLPTAEKPPAEKTSFTNADLQVMPNAGRGLDTGGVDVDKIIQAFSQFSGAGAGAGATPGTGLQTPAGGGGLFGALLNIASAIGNARAARQQQTQRFHQGIEMSKIVSDAMEKNAELGLKRQETGAYTGLAGAQTEALKEKPGQALQKQYEDTWNKNYATIAKAHPELEPDQLSKITTEATERMPFFADMAKQRKTQEETEKGNIPKEERYKGKTEADLYKEVGAHGTTSEAVKHLVEQYGYNEEQAKQIVAKGIKQKQIQVQ
jgi:hypothetical protein